ncbi:MAG: hypothetical protein REI94_13735 [Moraxellaceae bacterium]|nr:hypothetical protein [Moraxellaceae bacterium]
MKPSLILLLAGASLFVLGCGAAPKRAQDKEVVVNGQKWIFGGEYKTRGRELTLTVNGDPVLRGSFAPYTPTQRLNTTYRGTEVVASCYFGSVLGGSGGKVGIVAGAIQGAKGKAADKCDMMVAGQNVESLYF